MPHFTDRLAEAVQRRGNPVCVGLDPRYDQLPAVLRTPEQPDPIDRAEAYRAFCQGIVDVVAPLVPVVKPQVAFFEQLGPPGMQALAEIVQYAAARGLLVILDAKRNDIGSTASAYADAWLGSGRQSTFAGDAMTVSPYLGADSLEPFVQTAGERDAGVFILVKTSNPGGGWLQDLVAAGQPVFRHVGQMVESLAEQSAGACGYGYVGAVVGATHPQQLAELRQAMPHTWFLVPGYGSQGGTAADVAAAFDDRGFGAVVNNSRGIIFAHDRPAYRDKFAPGQWQDAVRAATLAMIDDLRAGTPAGKLVPR